MCNKHRLQDSKRNFGHSSVSVIELDGKKESKKAPRRSRVFRKIYSFQIAEHVLALKDAPIGEFPSVVSILNVRA